METFVALLRGVNVGGKNKLPMKELAAIFVKAGGANVRWYIQSGNVIFQAPAQVAAKIPARIHQEVHTTFGFSSPVITRNVEEMTLVVANNPFLAEPISEDALHVAFLASAPESDRIATLDPNRSLPDEFAVRGREIYLRLPNGAGRSKLTNAYFDSKLRTVSTVRNWRTVLKLLDLMQS